MTKHIRLIPYVSFMPLWQAPAGLFTIKGSDRVYLKMQEPEEEREAVVVYDAINGDKALIGKNDFVIPMIIGVEWHEEHP